MVSKILKEAIDKLNALNLKEKRRGTDTGVMLDIRNEIVSLKLTYEDYLKGKLE